MMPTLSKIIRNFPNGITLTHWKLKLLKNRERFKIRQSKILGYSVQYPDQLSLYFEFKDIFKNKIYHFNSQKREPLIIDAGSCIGMSILYFKHVYQDARIIGFEPDREIFKILQNNIKRNNLSKIELINAALSSRLKMNIEGAELDVLTEISDKLHYINEMVIEYHSFDNSNQMLHKILDLLNQNGFMYLINDFDGETNPAVRTPFKLGENTRYFLLIYAKRKEAVHDNT
jgi:predicted O-methyltransferase YrrM